MRLFYFFISYFDKYHKNSGSAAKIAYNKTINIDLTISKHKRSGIDELLP